MADTPPEQQPTPEPIRGDRLFGRVVRVVVGPAGEAGEVFEKLRMSFSVKKSDGKRPDPSKVQIYNLTEDHRSFIETGKNRILVYAGYGLLPRLIFQGDIEDVTHKRDPKDTVTEIEARDGAVAYKGGAISVTYEPPINSTTIISRVAAAMGLGIASFPSDITVVDFQQGFTFVGPGRDALDEIMESTGAKWMIQDGELVITLDGEATPEASVFLNTGFDGTRNTGLLTVEKTKKGIKAKSLLNGNIKPRRQVFIKSEKFSGLYTVKTVEHAGDSGYSSDFYTNIEAVLA